MIAQKNSTFLIHCIIRPWMGTALLVIATSLLVLWTGTDLRFPDEIDYAGLADSLRGGNGFRMPDGALTAYRPPGFPFFLWAAAHTGHEILTAKLLQALLLGATALVCSDILKRLGARFTALPAWMILTYPVLLFTAATLYPQTLGSFLFVCVLWLMFFHSSLISALLAGLLLGFLILNIPAFMLTAPILACVLLAQSTLSFRHRILRVSFLTVFALAVVAPWTYRNYKVFETFVPVSTNSGLNLFLGNSPGTTPGSGIRVDRSHLDEDLDNLPEIERDRRYRQLAVDWIRTHPRKAFRLYLGKALHYFHFTNRLATASESGIGRDVIMLLTWGPLLTLFLIRPLFWKRFPFHPFERAIWILVVSNVFLSAIFFTRIRFRIPFDVLIILANAFFFNRLLESLPVWKYTEPLEKSHEGR